ncbi:MAG: carbohydrate kinase family protein, partial [Nitrososphaerales archaeon]
MIDLAVIGAVNWDVNLFVEEFAEVGGEVPVTKVSEVPGGKGANVAVAAARILGSGRVSIMGGLGLDDVAERQIDILTGEGVDTSMLKRVEGVKSGRAYIIIDSSGRKMIHTLFGANQHLLAEDILTPRYGGLIRQTRIIVVIDPVKETVLQVAKKGREAGRTVLFAPGVRCAEGLEELADPIRNADYLVGNRVELECLVGSKDLESVRSSLLKINPRLKIIATLGADGSSLLDRDGRADIPRVNLSIFGLKIVNTTGCGDAFLGAFCAS